MGSKYRPRPPRRPPGDWEWIGFRIDPKVKVQVLALMRRRAFRDYREYFTFLIRQELRDDRGDAPPAKDQSRP